MVISCFFVCLFYSLQVSTGLLEKARNPSKQRYKLGLYKEGKKGFFFFFCDKHMLEEAINGGNYLSDKRKFNKF